jgi:hypothetical protein
MTLRIERSARQGIMVFTLSGRIKAEEVAELKALFDADYTTIVLDLREVRLADRDAVKFLRDCEADGMKLENCPAYLREWMEREKN